MGCDRLPETFHGKQGVCRGLPPVAGGPLPVKEGSTSSLRKRQVLRTRRPTGLDSMTLTRVGSGVNARHACATHRHAETGREALVRRRVTTTVMASAMPVRASVRSATFVTVIALSVGATAASNAKSSIKESAARTLSRPPEPDRAAEEQGGEDGRGGWKRDPEDVDRLPGCEREAGE